MDTAFENFTSAETLPALVESYQDTEDAQGRRLDEVASDISRAGIN